MFNLRRYFSLTSAAVIIVITVVLAIFYRQYAMKELVEIAERQNVILAQSFANFLWPRFSSVMSVPERDGDALRARPETPEIHEVLEKLTAKIPVLKVKIYDLDGLTVYSSEPSQIGADESNNPRFLRAGRGAAVSQLSHRETFNAFSGVVEDRDLVASYVPILDRNGRVEGVFELYADVTPLVVRIGKSTTELVVVLLLSFGLMYGCLFLIVRRADLILKKQYIELEDEVAERKRGEEALRGSERRTTLLMNSVPALISYIDREKRFQFNNKAYEDLLGRSVGELRGVRVEEVLGDTAYQVAKPQIEKALAGQRSRFENVIRNHAGEERIIDVFFVPDVDEAGTVNGLFALVIDITERKRADLVLRRQALVLEQMSDGVVITDLEGKIIDWNPGAERMFGYEKDEVLGEMPGVLHRPTEAEHLTAKIIEGMNRYGSWVGEITFIRKDGTEGICEGLVVPFYDEQGEQVATIAVNRDITERKRAENALRAAHDTLEQRVKKRTVELEREITDRKRAEAEVRESRELLQAVIDGIPAIVNVKDRTGRFVIANPAQAAFYGLTPGEMVGSTIDDILDPDYARMTRQVDLEVMESGQPTQSFEDPAVDPEGVETTWLTTKAPIRAANGPVTGVLTVSVEITRMKRAEAALKESEALLRQAVRMGRMGYWEWDPRTRTYITCSEELAQLYGYSADEYLKQYNDLDSLMGNIHPDDLDVYGEAVKASEESLSSYEVEFRERVASGEIRYFREYGEPVLDEEGRSLWTMGIVQDITEFKKVEEALEDSKRVLEVRVVELEEAQRKLEQQGAELLQVAGDLKIASDQAEAANRTKSEFLAAMSHELRTPLNAVIGFSEMIKGEMLGPVGSPQYRGYASDIYGAGRHLLALINDILDLSKVESGAEELHEDSIEVPELVQSVMKLVRQRAENGAVKLQLDTRDDHPLLLVDERKLKQILANLLSNAVKFTDPGGQVTLKAWCRPDSGFVFQVVDTGIGIAPEDIPKALSQFGQIDSGLNRKHEGTGLGLPLTKSLVELHGGSLDLQSQLGVGTTVTVRLPAARIVWPVSDAGRSAEDGRAAS